jgi:hypothetical protein
MFIEFHKVVSSYGHVGVIHVYKVHKYQIHDVRCLGKNFLSLHVIVLNDRLI